MRTILRVLFLFIVLIVIVAMDMLTTNNTALSQTQGYLSSEDCPECETEVANYNLHFKKLKEAGGGKKRFSVPVNLVNNVQLAKLIAQRCLASCAGTDNQFLSAIIIDLIQVFSISGNNPYNPVDPITGGDTTGRGEAGSIQVLAVQSSALGNIPLTCITGGTIETHGGGCSCTHLHGTITVTGLGVFSDPDPFGCGLGCIVLMSQDELRAGFENGCD